MTALLNQEIAAARKHFTRHPTPDATARFAGHPSRRRVLPGRDTRTPAANRPPHPRLRASAPRQLTTQPELPNGTTRPRRHPLSEPGELARSTPS